MSTKHYSISWESEAREHAEESGKRLLRLPHGGYAVTDGDGPCTGCPDVEGERRCIHDTYCEVWQYFKTIYPGG